MAIDLLFLQSLILVPLTGLVVRYRAGYYAKPIARPSLQVQATSDASSTAENSVGPASEAGTGAPDTSEPAVAPAAPSFLHVAKRVKRLEGWSGFYKGFLPTLLFNIFFLAVTSRVFALPIPTTTGQSLGTALFYNMFCIPGLISVYRAIVTTENLEISGTSIRSAMQALFSDHERKKFWVLWLIPGLLPTVILHVLLHILAFRPLREIIQPEWPAHFNEIFNLRMGATILLFASFTVILSPLDVIATRLVIQRGGSATNAVSVGLENEFIDIEKQGVDMQPEVESESEELVVRLRQNKAPYQGLYDCATKIVNEEGWQVLYRGWWLVLLSNIFCY